MKRCYFCQNAIGELGEGKIQLWCFKHPVQVSHWYGGDKQLENPFDVHFKIKIKGKLYMVVIYPYGNRTKVYIRTKQLLTLPHPSVVTLDPLPKSQYYLDQDQELLNAPYIVNITPENAKKKIPTIATFS